MRQWYPHACNALAHKDHARTRTHTPCADMKVLWGSSWKGKLVYKVRKRNFSISLDSLIYSSSLATWKAYNAPKTKQRIHACTHTSSNNNNTHSNKTYIGSNTQTFQNMLVKDHAPVGVIRGSHSVDQGQCCQVVNMLASTESVWIKGHIHQI